MSWRPDHMVLLLRTSTDPKAVRSGAAEHRFPHCIGPSRPHLKPMATPSRKKATTSAGDVRLADNKKAMFNYAIEERFEAGMVLQGWEVKALREGKVQLTDGYVVVR